MIDWTEPLTDWTLPLAARTRRKKQQPEGITPEEQESLLRRLASPVLSGLGYVGETLDKPGAAVRGTLSGLTGGEWGGSLLNLIPFSDALGITDPSQRVSGRGLLENWGALEPNRPGLDVGDVAGVGAEIVLDPLAWVGLPGVSKALTKGGQAARKAGLLKLAPKAATVRAQRVAQEAASALGTVAEPVGRIGPRVAAQTMTPREVIRYGYAELPFKQQLAAHRAARKALRTAAGGPQAMREIWEAPLGGTFGISAYPMGPTAKVFSPGGTELARALDVLGGKIRYSRPVAAWMRLFGREIKQAPGPMQPFAAELGAAAKEGDVAAREAILPMGRTFFQSQEKTAAELTARGVPGEEIGETLVNKTLALRQAIEAPPQPSAYVASRLAPELEPVAAEVRKLMDDALVQENIRGVNTADADEAAKYLHRQFYQYEKPLKGMKPPGRGFGTARAWPTDVGPAAKQRLSILRDQPGGSTVEDLISRDPLFSGVAWQQGKGGEWLLKAKSNKELDALAKSIYAKYGFQLKQLTPQMRGELSALEKLAEPTAEQVKRLEELRALRKEPRQLAKWFSELDPRHAATPQGSVPRVAGEPSVPIWGLDPLREALSRVQRSNVVQGVTGQYHSALAQTAQYAEEVLPGHIPVTEALERAGLTHNGGRSAQEYLAGFLNRRYGQTVVPDLEGLAKWQVPEGLADEMTRTLRSFTQPEEIKQLGGLMDRLMDWWRASVTTATPFPGLPGWPAFQHRNFFSGQVANAANIAGGPLKILPNVKRIYDLWRGRTMNGAGNNAYIRSLGKDLSDAQASEELANLMGAHRVYGRYGGQALEPGIERAPTRLAEEIPGLIPRPGYLGHYAMAVPKTVREAIPFQTRGPFAADITASAVAGRSLHEMVEATNRGALFLTLLDEGWAPARAAAKVELVHGSYRGLTPAERGLRQIMPFYSFTSAMFKYLADELAQRPGGRLAQIVRASSKGREKEPFVPDYLSQTLSIPIPEAFPLIGPKPGGDPRYLGGMGLMHEDPLQLLPAGMTPFGRGTAPSPRMILQELGSRSAPWIKAPVEWATGTSLFQAGPEGGRMLEDMDPAFGRLLANVSGGEEAVKFPGSAGLEQVLSSLTPRPLTTARTLTDPRKRWGETVAPGPAALINVLTGMRVYDLPQRTQEGLIREAVEAKLRQTGAARTFQKVYVPKEELASMSPEERGEAESLTGLLSILGKRAKQRAQGEQLQPLRTW